MTDRWITLDGLVNMRDVGGLPAAAGGRTQPRRLIRSDNLQDLTAADVSHLVGELGVTDVVDLRTETELHLGGPGPLRAVKSLTHHHHSLIVERPGEHVVERALTRPPADHERRRDPRSWAEHYLGYLAHRAEAVSAALRVVADARGATVVHCAAGKDRTGTVVALALDVAGVPHDEIVADYLLSAERLDAVMQRLNPGSPAGDALAAHVLDEQRPRPEAVQLTLTTLAERWGGAAGWLRAHGWSDDDIARLRDRLTAP
ncbi:MAG: tyrosine-protein phosphatase [Dermatophilaceae bacterium]